MTDSRDIERRYSNINIFRRGSRRAPHKPLLLAWAIARCLRGLDRLAPFDLAERELSDLLAAFGARRADRPGAHFPFWRLQNDEGVWEIDSPRTVHVDKNGQASASRLRALGVRAGLSADDYAHFPESLRDSVLSAAGFDAVDPPDAAAAVVSPRTPDLRPRQSCVRWHNREVFRTPDELRAA